MLSRVIRWLLCAAMLLGLPLVGVWLTGRELSAYLDFPPLTRYVAHAPFDWRVFAIIGALNTAMLVLMVFMFHTAAAHLPKVREPSRDRFPIWGWLGAALMLAGWGLAWSRFNWFALFQKHTFAIPWVGYIVLVNAWCMQRSGRCPMTQSPGRFALLWPVSAAFWWFFEYLNRFVQNWYYVNVDDFGPVGYIGFASLAFATVLPAVLSTHALLLTWPIFNVGLNRVHRIRITRPGAAATAALAVSGCGLMLMSVYPDLLYPLVWCAPLIILTALQTLWGRHTLFHSLSRGDWRHIMAAAMSALICGFFWELWNIYSLAQWRYAIPFVDRFHLFAMPLLGYGGYLPFGLECLVVGQPIIGNTLDK